MAQITDIQDHGTIIIVEIGERLVYFDHRQFQHFAEIYDYDFQNIEFETDGETVWEQNE
jgi:hypothetical protein